MGMCRKCGQVYGVFDMVDGVCKYCLNPELINEAKESKSKYEVLEADKKRIFNEIIITTEGMVDLPIAKRINVISSECVYGMNFMKDMFAFVRDIVGGRINSIEFALKEARAEIIADLRQQAYLMNGDAVIAVKIEHTYNNANSGSILSVFATGTVVKLQKIIKCYECGKEISNMETSCPHCGAPMNN
ncbi:MAG: heavy metal-binding domain-containing protein [Sulfurimonas sp.]